MAIRPYEFLQIAYSPYKPSPSQSAYMRNPTRKLWLQMGITSDCAI